MIDTDFIEIEIHSFSFNHLKTKVWLYEVPLHFTTNRIYLI